MLRRLLMASRPKSACCFLSSVVLLVRYLTGGSAKILAIFSLFVTLILIVTASYVFCANAKPKSAQTATRTKTDSLVLVYFQHKARN